MSDLKVDKPVKSLQIESNWVKKIQKGDSAAFEKLFRMYCQSLIDFAHRYVGEIESAENLVQDVFLKIWENRTHLNPDLNIKAYLYTAVKNQAFKHLRHLNVERQHAENPGSSAAEIVGPDEELAQKELAESIQGAVAELPEKCRIIFAMNRFDGLTYAEIAEIQDISVKTVENQMGRALKFLRKRLALFFSAFPL